MSQEALIVVDMIDQFVYGEWANKRAQAIVPNIVNLTKQMKDRGALIVAACDSHKPNDPELSVWGNHAMAGTPGSELIPELKGLVDFQVAKQTYDAFYKTSLDKISKEWDVTEVVIAGVLTNICVRHTAFGAFIRGLAITVPADCVEVMDIDEEFAEELQETELSWMKQHYGATIVKSWREL
jgi:nicotinamidase-related amidase